MHLSIGGRPEEPDAIRALHAALDSGMTLIDTADVYCLDDSEIGHNERLIRKGLQQWRGPSAEIVVATKGGLTRPQGRWERNGRPEHLRAACERSLKALGVEAIALYQLHAPDGRVRFEESVGALAQLREEGKILRVGLSNVSVAQIGVAEGIVPVASVQNRLNPFFREALEEGVVSACAARGIAFLAYSPTGGGRLNLKLPSHPTVAEIARRHGASAHQVVLAWVLAQGATVIPIPSARNPGHARDSAQAASLNLSAREREMIDHAEFSIA